MSWTNWGFDGTINEAQWSQMAGLLGNGYVAAGNGDCVVTAVGGARSVSVAAGTLYGDGVVSVNSGAETVAMTTPVNGQWYVIVLTRTWATNSVALRAVAGATTSTTTPTVAPTSFPTLNTNVGVLTDQPIAWAWCNSANTTVVVFDIRLKAVKSLPPVVATAAERDAKFMSPTQGLQVWRDDLGAVETYFGLYNSSTNPGGRDTAGWYTTGRNSNGTQIKAGTVTAVSGTATQDALGSILFSGCTAIYMDSLFTTKFKNYEIVLEWLANAGSQGAAVYCAHRIGGVAQSGYYGAGVQSSAGGLSAVNLNASTQMVISSVTTSELSSAIIKVIEPMRTEWATILVNSQAYYNNNYYLANGAIHTSKNARDGFGIWIGGAGNMTGKISVYGVN